MDDAIARIQEFICGTPPKGTNAFLATYKQNGRAFIRQVSCFVEGWTVGTIASHDSAKVMQIRDNPAATYLWVETCPDQIRRRDVWMSGDTTDQKRAEGFRDAAGFTETQPAFILRAFAV